MTLTIRPAIITDIEAIVHLEKTELSAWNHDQIAAELKQTNSSVMVAVDCPSAMTIGWACLRWIKPEAELFKIAIDQKQRRQGFGSQLLEKLVTEASLHGCNVIFLEVRAANLAARKLYLKSGFTEYGVRKHYYQNPNDDAALYKREISP